MKALKSAWLHALLTFNKGKAHSKRRQHYRVTSKGKGQAKANAAWRRSIASQELLNFLVLFLLKALDFHFRLTSSLSALSPRHTCRRAKV